jgi:processive 1,2-diacylglycerol beta-glucosyltransferase
MLLEGMAEAPEPKKKTAAIERIKADTFDVYLRSTTLTYAIGANFLCQRIEFIANLGTIASMCFERHGFSFLLGFFFALSGGLSAAQELPRPPLPPAALESFYLPSEYAAPTTELGLLAAPIQAPLEKGGAVILYGPFGGGHEMAAKALKRAFERTGRKAEMIDITSYQPAWQAAALKRTYVYLQARFPKALEIVYDLGERLLRFEPALLLKRWFDQAANRRLAEDLIARAPEAVLSTYLPSRAVDAARADGRLNARYGVVVTDWRSHGAWVDAEADRFYVAGGTDDPSGASGSDRMVRELAARRVERPRILASGIPVDPDIALTVPERASDKPTALVMGGGFGAGGLLDVVRGFAGGSHVHLEIVAGKNEELRAQLQALVRELGLDATVHGFVPHDRLMPKMAGTDLVVTKPGGLTITEAQALGRPLVLVGPAYAQEKGNESIVIERKAGASAAARDAGRAALALLGRPQELARMGRASRGLANAGAAEIIVRDMLGRGRGSAPPSALPPAPSASR